jgi:hypothetical protein
LKFECILEKSVHQALEIYAIQEPAACRNLGVKQSAEIKKAEPKSVALQLCYAP